MLWEEPVPGAGGAKGAIVRGRTVHAARTVREGDTARVVCALGEDGGTRWRDVGTIVSAPSDRDLGDGCLLDRGRGTFWYVYRDNRLRESPPRFSIRVAQSRDAGRTWEPHSVVAEASGARRGLWSPSLLRLRDGRILCLHDDEDTPHREGFAGHQWLVSRTWNPVAKVWDAFTVVSRAHDPAHLSRDGMGTAVDLGGGVLVATLESVGTDPLHASVVRQVRSIDSGKTWSWSREERAVVHAEPKPRFAAFAPWLTRLSDRRLVCVFTTNGRQEVHDPPGTPAHRLHGDVALRWSDDAGKTWSEPETVYTGGGRNYMPHLLETGRGRVVCLLLDFALDRFVAVPGRLR